MGAGEDGAEVGTLAFFLGFLGGSSTTFTVMNSDSASFSCCAFLRVKGKRLLVRNFTICAGARALDNLRKGVC